MIRKQWMLIVAYCDGKTEYMTFASRDEAHSEMERRNLRSADGNRPATMVVTPVDEVTVPASALRHYAAPTAA